mmetsp:Transcript_30410/g.71021  ORF Transcript_30410/g.71021 Transcript_30410/m.71021 type:complete len:295 (-) Transcript_30410:499-1383(-)
MDARILTLCTLLVPQEAAPHIVDAVGLTTHLVLMQLCELVLERFEVFATLRLAVVVCVKHQCVVKIDEKGCLCLAEQERNVHHLKLLSNLKKVIVLRACICGELMLKVQHDCLVKQISGNHNRGTRPAVPSMAGVEHRACLLILAESKEGTLVCEGIASLSSVDLGKHFGLHEPLREKKSGTPRQDVEPLTDWLARLNLLLGEESLERMLGEPVEGIGATKASRVDLEHRLVITHRHSVAESSSDCLNIEHQTVSRSTLVRGLNINLDAQRCTLAMPAHASGRGPWTRRRSSSG